MKDMIELYVELRGDFDEILKPKESGNVYTYPDPIKLTLSERRALIRALFSFVEAILYCLTALLKNKKHDMPEVKLALEGKQVEIRNNGEVTLKKIKTPFITYLNFCFRQFRDYHNIDHKINTNEDGYQSLMRAAKVRDRLMHPKMCSDIRVTDEEIRDAVNSFSWFDTTFVVYVAGAVKNMSDKEESTVKNVERIMEEIREKNKDIGR